MNALLIIKICAPVVLGMLLHMVLFAVQGEFRWLELCTCAFAQFSFGIGMYVCNEIKGTDGHILYAVKGKDGMPKEASLNVVCMILSVVFNTVFSIAANPNLFPNADRKVFIAGICSLIIMDFIVIMVRYKSTIESICEYENTFLWR